MSAPGKRQIGFVPASVGKSTLKAPFIPTIPDGWTLPPISERPKGLRVIMMVEVEWVRSYPSADHFEWARPDDQRRYRLIDGAPGVYGFAPLPTPAEGGAA